MLKKFIEKPNSQTNVLIFFISAKIPCSKAANNYIYQKIVGTC